MCVLQPGKASCLDVTDVCDYATEYEAVAPNSYTDRECRRVTECRDGEYQERGPTKTSDRECPRCNYPCQNCKGPNNGDCTSCGDFFLLEGGFPGEMECAAVCPQGFYGDVGRRACVPMTQCPPGHFESTPGTPTSDRECVACVAGTADHDKDITTPCLVRRPLTACWVGYGVVCVKGRGVGSSISPASRPPIQAHH